MKKRLVQALVVVLVTMNAAVGFRVYQAVAAPEKDDSGYASIAVFARALQLVRQDYVNEGKTSYEDLTHAALRGMLSNLDPHSQFMEPKDFKGMQDDTNSRFGGLGVVVSQREGDLIIVSPMEDSPGFKAGLLPGDKIVKIDGESTEKMDLNDAVNRLRGEPGTKITLTILRSASKEIKDYPLVRETIKVASVKDAKLLPAEQAGEFKIGYARITQFNVPTADDLARKLDEMEKGGLQALVLDLRYNPGGLLNSAVDVAGLFLPPKTLVVSTEGRVASQSRSYRTLDNARQRGKYPIAVLINSGSASGSEIVAGALKDLNRAILVGETTFGKGSVQSVIQLQDGSAMRLTTAKYYTPSKQVIHERGVSPTIRATLSSEQERMLMVQRNEEAMTEAQRTELQSFRDTQLERAVDALKGVMIYGEKAAGKRNAS
ncbi:MAG TPA: S41 family peptidase [Chthoniobacteraceae bacterium]|jgi:carboxyl-terminal processing protease|nr:S41 family peptidase [Chthoniobacteraceae bacterium]